MTKIKISMGRKEMNILKRTTLILLSISMFTAFSVPVFAEGNFKEADPVTYNLQEDIRDGEYNVVGTKWLVLNILKRKCV
ncbi:hypothetical protein B9G55_04145 [Saccharibacillus sp. O16]|nr:hypothetical protein B9G55_04145 [Saccharibacillus sp. O16]